jgi:hypothetical protein
MGARLNLPDHPYRNSFNEQARLFPTFPITIYYLEKLLKHNTKVRLTVGNDSPIVLPHV